MKERFLLEDDKNYLEQIIPKMREESINPDGSETSRRVATTVLERAIIQLDKVRKELKEYDTS